MKSQLRAKRRQLSNLVAKQSQDKSVIAGKRTKRKRDGKCSRRQPRLLQHR
jgi:hypothetical protein